MNENVDMFPDAKPTPPPASAQLKSLSTGKAAAAMLAFAVGDALGWPFEGRARAKGGKRPAGAEHFQTWTRSGGGRYYRHDEPIAAGEYSDDTQLMLAVARSLLRGEGWTQYFSTVELPYWLLYERGGGSATLRAAASWAKQRAPWQAGEKSVRARYFDAGGNGGAMRVLPHAIWWPTEKELIEHVDADAICTHGHPRAIIGARIYAAAAWHCLRQKGTLGYGSLLDTVVGDPEWRVEPHVPELWLEAYRALSPTTGFDHAWAEVLSETDDLLEQARQNVQKGALALDDDALRSMNVTDSYMGGAGTVTAVAAIYLASRNAAQPAVALRRAATLKGADTDTLAAMTSGLLGALHGAEWLNSFAQHVQDAEYICGLAGLLAEQATQAASPIGPSPDAFMASIAESAAPHSELKLPDGRTGRVEERSELAPGKKYSVTRWRIRTEDGQSIAIKKTSRSAAKASRPSTPVETRTRASDAASAGAEGSFGSRRVGMRLLVRDLVRTRRFYSEWLGLPVTKEGRASFTVASALTFSQSEAESALLPPATDFTVVRSYVLQVEVDDIRSAYNRLLSHSVRIVDPVTSRGTALQFRCFDDDGHLINVFQVNASQPTGE